MQSSWNKQDTDQQQKIKLIYSQHVLGKGLQLLQDWHSTIMCLKLRSKEGKLFFMWLGCVLLQFQEVVAAEQQGEEEEESQSLPKFNVPQALR